MTMARNALLLVAGIVVGIGITVAARHFGHHPHVQLDTQYQAVLLDNGQVYFGKLEAADSAFPVLKDVYYIQSKVDPQTKAVNNVLVRRGKEWHSPDRMVLNSRHVILMEPVGADSQVAKLIADSERH